MIEPVYIALAITGLGLLLTAIGAAMFYRGYVKADQDIDEILADFRRLRERLEDADKALDTVTVALEDISAMETPSANATVRRMAARARDALDAIYS